MSQFPSTRKIKLVAKLKVITMLASKVFLEIRFACETLNHQDNKKFKNFANKTNVMGSWFILVISAKTKLQLNSSPQTSSSPKYLDLTMRSQ